MIITDLSAENVLKYASLELKDLPESGVIAIGGPNESGKSTIGETICFALFGRTFSLQQGDIQKLIRWGEMRCSVNLRFKSADGQHYEIARFLDRDGNHGVRLNPAGNENQLIARGIEPVDNALYEILGYGYDEFIESFYLAQREITTPHPHSYAVKAMAGLSSLEYVAYEFEEEIAQEKDAIDVALEEIATLDEELEELGVEEGALNALEGERDALIESEAVLQAQQEELESASTAYQNNHPRIHSAASARSRAKFLRFIMFIVGIAAAVGWGLLARMPEHEYAQTLASLLQEQVPGWSMEQLPWLMYGALGAGVLFILFWIRVALLGGRIASLGEASKNLSEKLAELHQAVPESESEGLAEDENEASADESRPSNGEITTISARIAAYDASPAEVRDAVGRELAWMRRELQQKQEYAISLEQKIWDEQERRRKADKLNTAKEGFEQRCDDHRQRIGLRELAGELLEGATRHLSMRFNRDLRDLVGRTLPLFTENRYEHLQIDEDLTVRVFSNEKRDFMDLEEISSGTQRQIMLAVRLALSQELVNSTVEGKQFIFLDEPFAFFDQERTRSAIQALPRLSDEITQVWIVAQEFPQEAHFDIAIDCRREIDDLRPQ